ncbi:MAG TPA: MotA/TolQ/ExbB proton channel family protein, partial [Devosiaceae bacterium]|nr:MotA/TolQ/ExbB proton channel family protein [Devosiaceae bacterium]
ISVVIIAIFLMTSMHCLYQTVLVSRELIAARKVRDAVVSAGGLALVIKDDQIVTSQGRTLEHGVVTDHISNLISKARTLSGSHLDQTLLLRSLADQLRSREKLGLFVAESLLRLALLGTAVGFILMLIPIAALDAFDVESLRQTLAGMSSGMAIALNITVAGIGTALFLKFTYYLLDEAIADLFHNVTELTEVYVIPTLEPKSDA